MRNFRKLIFSALLLLGLVMGLTALTAAAAEQVIVKSETDVAGDLGILQGDGNGLTAEYLSKSTTRFQAAIMFLRLKGLEREALAFSSGQDNFRDASLVYKEGQSILAYLKAHPELGWQGTGDNMFDPQAGITAQAYYKVMLEALGYKQGVDFEFAGALAFAEQKGLSKIAGVQNIVNMNIATASIEALGAPVKGSTNTLAADLSTKGILSSNKLDVLTYPSLQLKQSEKLGSYLSDSKGMTLYYFTKDVADINSCVGDCLVNWPIFYDDQFIVPAGFNAADFSVFVRKDGKQHVTYKGWPLYYFAKDQKVGDTIGEAVGKVWYVIKPSNGISVGTKADLGNFLTDANGMALYYYDKDTKGVSNCSGKCLEKWPLFYAEHLSAPTGVNQADFGTIIRADGKKQTTYKGFPLYYWVDDKKMGDTLGQNVGNVWFVIDPVKFSGTKAVNSSVKTTKSDQLGTYLVDSNGMALYLFTKDKADPNSCVGQCLVNWPIFYDANLTVSGDLNASDFGVLTRNDGTMQNTYKGWPLYYWIKDKNPGDTTGQNVGKVWFVLDPAKTENR
ncbi:hypothetical protein [Paenibacillus sedimenti]|uniref:Lipoprotein with Yx(FWY)xxD motif n=1 Tax=Paenibacillus sedimenti TaxID=2770274 RepID=A0A926KMC4_9BACL|nr:hypothetical protein [Paenibacillus sedimenti]MBD0378908.1 hypothetical protein [Paenibacillus sedimenti]